MKVLIVGQGLAGTLAGYRFERAGGHTVHYIDAPEQTAASSVAAGIINPITGRRFVKSWKIDELLPEALSLYAELAELLGKDYWHPQPLIRTLYNRGDMNDWQVRTADPGYQNYMEDRGEPGRITELTEPVFAYAGVRHAGRVDVAGLVADYRAWLTQEGRVTATIFDYGWVPELLGGIAPSGHLPLPLSPPYQKIIFCEGWRSRGNPYFSWLGHTGNKGEVLIIRTEAPVLDRMFKHRVFLVPFGLDTYWVGATSENRFDNDAPSGNNGQFLRDRLAEVLTVPYEVVEHRAAVRPTSKDRRMMIGTHPADERLAVFNGLGTKGASLGPLGSKWLFELLVSGKQLLSEVDIARFSKPSGL